MDHGTCNIDVGCSINIQRTDGEWTAREYPSGFIIVQASARRRRPRSGPAPSRSGADSFILPRISVFPLAFLSSATSLHPRFRIYRSLLFSWNPQVLRLSLSLSLVPSAKDRSPASSSSVVSFLSAYLSLSLYSFVLSFI